MVTAERSVSDVLHDILRNVQDIVRSEVRLAKTEVREEVMKARSAATLVAVGVVAGVFSALFLLLTIAFALTLVIPAWAAMLSVAVGVGIMALLTMVAGLKRFKSVEAAPKTVNTIQENIEWAKQQIK